MSACITKTNRHPKMNYSNSNINRMNAWKRNREIMNLCKWKKEKKKQNTKLIFPFRSQFNKEYCKHQKNAIAFQYTTTNHKHINRLSCYSMQINILSHEVILNKMCTLKRCDHIERWNGQQRRAKMAMGTKNDDGTSTIKQQQQQQQQ